PRRVQVGVRELRQNLSVYLRRVKKGELLEVTEHGHLVAMLVPPEAQESFLDRWVAKGWARRATLDIRDLPPPLPLPPGERPPSEILQEMRDEDDR
ncbi:MAG TPA: type II toxin-antitoxin system prevent-host-death family antitoxin, partial [Terriglobales bacterium]|nr:type II toxin-antitoxin system prevent-host-death family antitoxin [Terriglobales bacterium]